MPEPPPKPRILIVRVGAMGDVLHALPAIALLHANLPDAFLAWAVDPRWSTLLQAIPNALPLTSAMPLVDHVHHVHARLWSKRPVSLATLQSIRTLRLDLHHRQYDLALDLQGSLRSAMVARLSGASMVLGSTTPREHPARWLYTHSIPTTASHVIDQALQLAQAALTALGLPAAGAPLAAPLPQDPASDAWANTLCANSVGSVVLLAPTAGWGAKQWPANRFAALAAGLIGHGCRVLVNSNPPFPDPVAHEVLETTHTLVTARQQKSIQAVEATLPQLTALTRRVHLVIAGDTGPLHLAAALGTPVVGLFGPTDPARNGPHSPNSTVLRHPSSITSHRRHVITDPGLARIPVDDVLAAAFTELRMRKSDGPAAETQPPEHV